MEENEKPETDEPKSEPLEDLTPEKDAVGGGRLPQRPNQGLAPDAQKKEDA